MVLSRMLFTLVAGVIITLWSCSAETSLDFVDLRKRVDGEKGNNNLVHYLEDPDLYYADDNPTDGDEVFVWAAESTAPRDVLVSRPVHVWLYVSVDQGHIRSLVNHFDRFVMHYASRGFELERIIFSIVVTSINGGSSRNALIRKVEALGADYHVHVATDTSALSKYISSLVAMEDIPLQDWVFMADAHELISFTNNDTVMDFIEGCERDGANCAIGTAPGGEKKYVAMRGYLRQNAEKSRIFENFDDMEGYLRSTQGICEHEDDNVCVEEYASYTPYDSWWEFYKSSRVVGNAYLWYPRTSDIPCSIDTVSMIEKVQQLPILDKGAMMRILASKDSVTPEG